MDRDNTIVTRTIAIEPIPDERHTDSRGCAPALSRSCETAPPLTRAAARSAERWSEVVTTRMAAAGPTLLRGAIAIVFLWFGALKLVGLSAADELVAQTVTWWDPAVFVPVLGAWEVAIGVCLLCRRLERAGLVLLFAQMAGTFLPLLRLPHVTFDHWPYAPTLAGQYIVKNIVIVAGACSLARRNTR